MTADDVLELVIAKNRHAPNPVFVRGIISALADEGMVIVPKEPTEAMDEAGWGMWPDECSSDDEDGWRSPTPRNVYRAMTDAI